MHIDSWAEEFLSVELRVGTNIVLNPGAVEQS
jgi:hypothetical protein